MTQFLPPISAITRLTWSWPAGVSAAAAHDLEPDGARAREGDQADPRVADQRRAGVALAGQQPERRRGHAGVVQRLDQRQGAAGRLLCRLQHDRVARRQRRGGHPGGDREREVPGRDHRRDPERLVAHRVALAGRLGQLLAAVELRRAERVVLEEVDRLADVGVGLRPRLRALAHLERGELGPAVAQGRGGAAQHRGALGRRCGRPLAGAATAATATASASSAAPARPATATTRSGFAGVGRLEPGADPRSPPISTGTSIGSPRSSSASAVEQSPRERRRGAAPGSARCETRPVHGAASSSSTGAPPWWARRKESLEVFSSSRRTR